MSGTSTISETTDRTAFVSPITPRIQEVFYSCVPVLWRDIEGQCTTCLPCSRDTFQPQTKETEP
jgi:hypothetical protein